MKTFEIDIIGTHLFLYIDSEGNYENLFRNIANRLKTFEIKFSRFIEGNWLYNLNISRRGLLDEDAMNMLLFMLDISRKTDGYFDPTVGKRLTELGYGNVSTMQNTGYKVQNGDYRDIEITGDEVILQGDVCLEFGGAGKGYLIDVIRAMILDYKEGIMNSDESLRYLINFGGDMYGYGGWKVGLESPFASDEVIGTLMLDDGFFACSAGTKRKWGKHHHLINPHTGESSREVIASYIEGNSGMITDVYATTLCVMPWEFACEVFEKTPEISGVIVRYDGSIFQKNGSKSEIFS